MIALKEDKNVALMEEFGVLTKTEMFSRYEVEMEHYSKILNIEARTMLKIANKQLIPAATAYMGEVAGSAAAKTAAVEGISTKAETKVLTALSKYTDEMSDAADDLKATTAEVKLEGATKNFFVYGLDRKNKHPLRILDKKGFIKVQRNDGKAVLCKAGSYRNIVSQLWEELAIYQQDAILRPDYYICAGARVMDFSGSVDLDKIMMLMEVEMQMINPGDDVIIVGAKNSL